MEHLTAMDSCKHGRKKGAQQINKTLPKNFAVKTSKNILKEAKEA
jgi:hypothetical protein